MPHNFGNNYSDGYSAKSYEYKPTWEKDVDYSPDHRPSSSAMYIEERGGAMLWALQVKGLGVITLRAGINDQYGVGIFSKAEIGYTPDL